jgi:S1-C subfamily serine protease
VLTACSSDGGDIVVVVNEKPVLGIGDLRDQITLHRPDEQIRVTLYRGPEKLTLDMKFTQRPQ